MPDRLASYVSSLAAEWGTNGTEPRHRTIDGSLCLVDISGFSTLSERLARRGRIGAEELTDVLSSAFSAMLGIARDHGGSLLKFGGDALLIMFQGPDHALHACATAAELRTALRDENRQSDRGKAPAMRMSAGVHSGEIDLFMVGDRHRELVLAGPSVTTVVRMEQTAARGQIVVSEDTRGWLPSSVIGSEVEVGGVILRWRRMTLEIQEKERHPGSPSTDERLVPTALRAYLSEDTPEPEHRLVTVGFVRLSGMDDLLARKGAEESGRALDEVVTLAQAAADDEGVTILGTDVAVDGVKLILVAGVPVAQEDDAGRMLRTMRRIFSGRSPFAMQGGVNRGHVYAGDVGATFRRTYTVMGDTVNLAAGLMDAAPLGAIYARPVVLDASRTMFAATELERVLVKGASGVVPACEVGEELGTVAETTQLPLFIGRGEELALVRSLIENTRQHNGGVITINGDTGIGKSMLIDKGLSEFPDLWRWTIRGEPNAVGSPYRALRDPLLDLLGITRSPQENVVEELTSRVTHLDSSLQPLLPFIGDVAHVEVPDNEDTKDIEPEFRRDMVTRAVSQLLAAALMGPGVVIVDDAQWLDEATTHVLRGIEAATADRPWALVVASRTTEGGYVPQSGQVVTLGPLGEIELTNLVDAATDAAPLRTHQVTSLVERCGGNPLFLGELIRTVRDTGGPVETLPDTLDGVVAAQIDALPAQARRALRYVSVLGQGFREQVMNEVLAGQDIRLDAATRGELIPFLEWRAAGRIRFRQALIRDSAYEGLSFRRRRQLHLQAGDVIERIHGINPETVADALATHFSAGQDHERAWRYGRVAGDRAMEAYANVSAAAHYERTLAAAAHLEDLAPKELADVWKRLAQAREQAGLFQPSLDALSKAGRLVRDDPVACAELHLERSRARLRVGGHVLALRETALGLRLLGDRGGKEVGRVRASLRSVRAHVRLQQGHASQALRLAQEAASEAKTAGDPDSLARSFTVIDNAYEMLGQPELAVHEPESLRIYEGMGDQVGVALIAMNLGVKAYSEGRWSEALELYQRSLDAYQRAGNDSQAAVVGANFGEALVSLRRFQEADDVLSSARRVLRAHDLVAYAIFAETQLARLAVETGRPEDAVSRLEDLMEEATEVGFVGIVLDTAVHLAAAHTAVDEPQRALAVIDRAMEMAGEEAAPFEVALRRARAEALSRLGLWTEAADETEAALVAAQRQGLTYERALLLMVRSQQPDRSEEATKDVEEAERLFHALGLSDVPAAT